MASYTLFHKNNTPKCSAARTCKLLKGYSRIYLHSILCDVTSFLSRLWQVRFHARNVAGRIHSLNRKGKIFLVPIFQTLVFSWCSDGTTADSNYA
jgi:hypothetical protein